MFGFEAIQILIFLIPGFIASKVLDLLMVRKSDRKDLDSLIEALIFSLLIYAIVSFTGIKSPVALDSNRATVIYPEPWSFFWLVLIGIAIPILLAWIANHDLHLKVARWLKITKKTSRMSVWNDVFTEKKAKVVIDFSDGRRLFGWVEHFSDDPEKPYIYLAQPQWIDGDNYIDPHLDGILLMPEFSIKHIEFIKDQDQGENKHGK
jgi:hypothetical protein